MCSAETSQNLLRSTAANRALVAAAVRYTFIDTSSAYDELIAPIIVEFLSLMHDENLVSREETVCLEAEGGRGKLLTRRNRS
jgi:hypothetical protein